MARQESFTRLPAEIVDYAEREHPETPIGDFFDRALRRVGESNAAEQKSLIEIGKRLAGKPFSIDLGWVRCPYSIESGVWERFSEIIEKRKEDPTPLLLGAVMAEIGMT